MRGRGRGSKGSSVGERGSKGRGPHRKQGCRRSCQFGRTPVPRDSSMRGRGRGSKGQGPHSKQGCRRRRCQCGRTPVPAPSQQAESLVPSCRPFLPRVFTTAHQQSWDLQARLGHVPCCDGAGAPLPHRGVSRYHGLCGLNNRHSFFTVLRLARPRSRCQQT